jgi:hypothetical protein
MESWREDLTTYSLEEILESQAENRAWSKELRSKASFLVNSRLANQITLEDYRDRRKFVHKDAAECRRRASILESQIARRVPPSRRLDFLGS